MKSKVFLGARLVCYLPHVVVITMLHWFSGQGNDGDGGRIPGTARAHPQIFQGTAGWGRQIIYIYIYIYIYI
jgi:hypothetical protein